VKNTDYTITMWLLYVSGGIVAGALWWIVHGPEWVPVGLLIYILVMYAAHLFYAWRRKQAECAGLKAIQGFIFFCDEDQNT